MNVFAGRMDWLFTIRCMSHECPWSHKCVGHTNVWVTPIDNRAIPFCALLSMV